MQPVLERIPDDAFPVPKRSDSEIDKLSFKGLMATMDFDMMRAMGVCFEYNSLMDADTDGKLLPNDGSCPYCLQDSGAGHG